MPATTTRPTSRRYTTAGIELRTTPDAVVVEGYASTFDQPYDMGFYQERVAQGAFTKTLTQSPDVRYLINHDGLPLARSSSGTLELSQDSTGLHTRATLDPADPDVQRIIPKMQRGDLNQMSFAFRTIRDEWTNDYTERSLRELSLSGGDVSIVTYPANPNATVSLRARTILEADPVELRAAYRAIREERVGKTISASTQKQLEAVLENLSAIDEATDEAVQTVAMLIGAMTGTDETNSADNNVRGVHPSVVRARTLAALLRK